MEAADTAAQGLLRSTTLSRKIARGVIGRLMSAWAGKKKDPPLDRCRGTGDDLISAGRVR